MKKTLIFTMLLLMEVIISKAATRYVKQGATGTGVSWADASGDFQGMIDAAEEGDSIWVAAGTYQPASGQSFSMKEGVKIFGGFAAAGSPSWTDRNWALYKDTLKGNNNSVILNEYNNLTNAAVLDGFIITDGNTFSGGGIYNQSSSPTISNCKFVGNHASNGGGICNQYSSPTISNCIFEGNSASSLGGGLMNDYSSLVIVNCSFTSNTAVLGAGVYTNQTINMHACDISGNSSLSDGGGIYVDNSADINLYNCTVKDNHAGAVGGGIWSSYTSLASINACQVYNNTAYDAAGIFNDRSLNITDSKIYNNHAVNNGGGIVFSLDFLTLTRDTIYNNTAGNRGGGMYITSGGPVLAKNLIYNNSAASGGAIYITNGTLNLSDNIFAGNTTTGTSEGGGAIRMQYANNITAKNNIFINNAANGSNGGALSLSGVIYAPGNAIENNSFYNNQANGTGSTFYGGGALFYDNDNGELLLRNNIFSNNQSNNKYDSAGADISLLFSVNNTNAFNNLLQLDSISYATATGILVAENIYRKNVSFVNAADPDGADNKFLTTDDGLQLLPCSPAVNSGVNTGDAFDITSNVRVGDYDLGAYELQTAIQPASLASGFSAVVQHQDYVTYYGNCNNEITTIRSNGTNPIIGNTTAKVWLEATQPSTPGAQFAKRHYEITPATNAATATGRVALYFTQPEFDDFNAVSAVDLPTGPADAIGIANLKIEKRSGISNDGSGLPGSYTGTVINIDPVDADIVWNATASRWEVSFDVAGFSGFFVKTLSGLLPVSSINFSAVKQNNEVLLQWQNTSESNLLHYEVERSSNGINFENTGTITARNAAGTNDYQLTDNTLWTSELRYYRLKMVDYNGKFTYSPVARLNNKAQNSISVYPNPVADAFTIQWNGNRLLNSTAKLLDASGKMIQAITIKNNNQTVDISNVSKGIYLLQLEDGTALKIIKQ